MAVIAEDPIEGFNRKALSFHVGEFDSLSIPRLYVEVDVELCVRNHDAKDSGGFQKPPKISHDGGRHRLLQMLKAMLAVYALQTVIRKRDSLSYIPA